MSNRVRTVAVLFVLVGFGLAASEVRAAGSSTLSSLSGKVYLVDPIGHTITLKDAGGTLTTLTVTRKSKIVRNKKKTTLGGLVLGDQATAVFDGLNNAKQLGATGSAVSTVRGDVLGVHSGTGIVHTAGGSFGTNAQTRVVRNGKVASLNALTVFDNVTAHVVKGSALSPAPDDTALDIQCEGPEESEVHGTIAAIGTNTVTITPKDGGANVTVNVTVDTLIEVGDAPATISDLTVGLRVEAEYDPTTFNAFRIEAETEGEDAEVEGTITVIDTALGMITIIDSHGTSITLTVNASTKIERNDESATIFDLQVGDLVKAEYNAATLVASEIEAGTESEDAEPEPEEPPDDD